MSITQKDIARTLGVAPSLVAMALQGNSRVAAATRARVEEKACEMGYSSASNPAARALAAQRYGNRVNTGTIAVLYQNNFHGRPLRTLPFFVSFFDAIEEECLRTGVDAVAMPLRTQGLQRMVREGLTDGVLLFGGETSQAIREHLKVPYVLLSAYAQNANCLRADGFSGMKQAVRHLVALGHRRIAYLGHPTKDDFISKERLDGYREGLLSQGLEPVASWEETTLMNQTKESVESGLRALWARHPDGFTAIVCHNDLMAMHAIAVMESWGLAVPGQVSVTGFDDTSVESGFKIPITSVFFDRKAMARRGVRLLHELIEQPAGEERSNCVEESFPVELCIRQSTAPVAA